MKDEPMYNENSDMTEEEAMNQGLSIIRRGETYSKKGRLFPQLTDNECIVFILTKCGFAQKKLAKVLRITQSTISRYYQKACEKLGF